MAVTTVAVQVGAGPAMRLVTGLMRDRVGVPREGLPPPVERMAERVMLPRDGAPGARSVATPSMMVMRVGLPRDGPAGARSVGAASAIVVRAGSPRTWAKDVLWESFRIVFCPRVRDGSILPEQASSQQEDIELRHSDDV